MMEDMCKIRCASEVRHSNCEDAQIISIILTLELETKPFDISHGYSCPWKQHLAMHQRRTNLKKATVMFLPNPKPCLPKNIAFMPHEHY